MATTPPLLKAISFMREPIRPPRLKHHPMWKIFPTHMPLIPPIKNVKTSTKAAAKLRVKCLAKYWNNNCGAAEDLVQERTQTSLFEVGSVVNAILKRLNVLKKPAVATVMLGALLLLSEVLAASGGRIGERSVSSSRSSYSCSSSMTCCRCKSIINETNSSDDADILLYDPLFFHSPRMCLEITMLVSTVLFAWFAWCYHFDYVEGNAGVLTDPVTTLLMLQVGLLGTATKSLQSELYRIGETANTSTSEVLNRVLKETSLALLQHEDSCMCYCSTVDVKENIKVAEKHFDQLSMEEQRKFNEKTLFNANSKEREITTAQKANGFGKEYMAITILLAVEGVKKLPTINTRADLKEALQKLGSIPSGKTKAVEVLWTPRSLDAKVIEGEGLTQRKARVCRKCGMDGHNVRTCKNPPKELIEGAPKTYVPRVRRASNDRPRYSKTAERGRGRDVEAHPNIGTTP